MPGDVNWPCGFAIPLILSSRTSAPARCDFFGLDYATLSARNPRLIYASITGYGQAGPGSGRMAYAPTVQAEAGYTPIACATTARLWRSREPTAPLTCRRLFRIAGKSSPYSRR